MDIQWLCDWSVGDYESNRGVGVRLFKRAVDQSTHLVCLSGNSLSLGILERMASRTLVGADIEMRLFLRADAVLERAQARLPRLQALRRTPLKSLPLRRVQAPRAFAEVKVEPGVAPSLRSILEATEEGGWRAVYDLDYVSWQIGRCPSLEPWTLTLSAGNGSRDQGTRGHQDTRGQDVRGQDVRAAAVLWRCKNSSRACAAWRAAVWVRPAPSVQAHAAARAVVGAAIARAAAGGAASFSVVTSKWDALLLGVLRDAGLRPTREQRPVFVFDTPRSQVQIDEVRGLNFLSTDLSYRF